MAPLHSGGRGMRPIERKKFIDSLSARHHGVDIRRLSPKTKDLLKAHGIDRTELKQLAGGDHILREKELGQLYTKLFATPAAKTGINGAKNLERAFRIYEAMKREGLVSQPKPIGTPTRTTGLAGATNRKAAPRPNAKTAEPTTTPKDAPKTPAPTADPIALLSKKLLSLELDKKSKHVPAKVYVDALRQYAARSEVTKGRRPKRPANVPPYVWRLARAAHKSGLTTKDLEHYVATGTIPDAAKMQKIFNRAVKRGRWNAVMAFNFMARMRKSALAAERSFLKKKQKELPANDPRHAEITKALKVNATTTKRIRRMQFAVATAATSARERTGNWLVRRASTLETRAAKARADGKNAKADRLEKTAKRYRARGAKILFREARYREAMGIKSWNAARTYRGAALAQIDRGAKTVAAMRANKVTLTDNVPSSLSADKTVKNKDGVPGAGVLLDKAKAKTTAAGQGRQLAARGRYQKVVADFHRLHLERSGYFKRYGSGTVPDRSAAAIAHRKKYLALRVGLMKNIDARLKLLGAKPKGQQAVQAADLLREKREIAGEMATSLAAARDTRRLTKEGVARVKSLKKAVAMQKKALGQQTKSAKAADAALKTAKSDNSPMIDIRSGTSRKLDQGQVDDSRTIAKRENFRVQVAKRGLAVMKGLLKGAKADVAVLKKQMKRDVNDAGLVANAYRSYAGTKGTPNISTAFKATTKIADNSAKAAAKHLDVAAKKFPNSVGIAARRVDLARYWVRSTQLDPTTNVPKRLDRATKQVDKADAARTTLKIGSKERTALAKDTVNVRAEIGAGYGGLRPKKALTQLDKASKVANTDLDKSDKARAKGIIGAASTTALIKNNANFTKIVDGGHYTPGVDDKLHKKAHANLDGNKSKDPVVRSAKKHLAHVDAGLKRVYGMLGKSGVQLENGYKYSSARVRSMARSEVTAAQSKVSVVISGPVYLFTAGHVDMKGMMADAGMRAARMRNFPRNRVTSIVRGSRALQGAWVKAQKEGKAFQFLNSLRIYAHKGNSNAFRARGAAGKFLLDRTPNGNKDANATGSFIFGLMKAKGGAPLAKALNGSVLNYRAADSAFGDKNAAVVTGGMRDGMKSQAKSLTKQVKESRYFMIANLGLETALGIVLTAGIGSGAAIANGSRALNAGKAAMQMTRAARAMQILRTVGVTAGVGAGMAGAQYGVKQVFGRRAADAFGVLTNFLPIAAGQNAMKLGQGALKAGAGATKMAMAAQRASFLGTRIAFGSGQAVATAVAMPHLAKSLGLERSEIGQMALSIGLNALLSGGIATGAMLRSGGSKARARAMAEGIVGQMEVTGNKKALTNNLTKEIHGFLKANQGLPTKQAFDGLRRNLQKHMGVRPGDTKNPLHGAVDGMVESIRLARAGDAGFKSAIGDAPSKNTKPEHVGAAVDAIAHRLFEARGKKSLAQAYHDAAEYVAGRLSGQKAHAGLARAAGDRAAAATIALAAKTKGAHFAAAKKVVSNAMPEARAKLERGQNLDDGFAKKVKSDLTKAGVDPKQADAIVGGLKRRAVADAAIKKLAGAKMSPAAALAVVKDLAAKAKLSAADTKTLVGSFAKKLGVSNAPSATPKAPSGADKVAGSELAKAKSAGKSADEAVTGAYEATTRYLLSKQKGPVTAADRVRARFAALEVVVRAAQKGKLPASALGRALDRTTAAGVTAKLTGQSPAQRAKVEVAVAKGLGEVRTAIASGDPAKIKSAYARLDKSLNGLGLSAGDKAGLTHAVKRYAVGRAALMRARQLQTRTGTTPTRAQLEKIGKDVASKAGMPPKGAEIYSKHFAKSQPVRKVLDFFFPKKEKPFAQQSIAEKRADLVARFPKAKDLAPPPQGKLTDAEFKAAFGDGPYAWGLVGLAEYVPNLAQLAKSNPQLAKKIYNAAVHHPIKVIQQALKPGQNIGSKSFETWIDGLKPHRDVASSKPGGTPDYDVIHAPPSAPEQPALRLIPKGSLDHNGAWQARGVAGKKGWQTIGVDEAAAMKAGQLYDGKRQFTDADMKHVAVFGGHGDSTTISNLKAPDAAKFIAAQIKKFEAGGNGRKIKYIVLDACGQGDKRGVLFGQTNAKAIQAELRKLGMKDVKILAASHAGSLKGSNLDGYLWGTRGQANFVTPENQAKFTISPDVVRGTGLGIGIAAAGAGAAYTIYKVLEDKKKD